MEANQHRDAQDLQKCWIQLRHAVRQMFRDRLESREGVTGKGKKVDIEKLKGLVHRLCVRDPHQLYQRLESQGTEFVMEIKVNLLQIIVSPDTVSSDTSGAMSLDRTLYFLRGMIRAFLESHITVTNMHVFLEELETRHLKRFGITWEIVYRHLFEAIVYQDSLIQVNLPAMLAQLGCFTDEIRAHYPDSETVKNAEQVPEYCTEFAAEVKHFVESMIAVKGVWERAQCMLERYTRQQIRFCKAKRRMLKQDLQFFKFQRRLLEKCVGHKKETLSGEKDKSVEDEMAVLADRLRYILSREVEIAEIKTDKPASKTTVCNLRDKTQGQTAECPYCRQVHCVCDECFITHLITCGIVKGDLAMTLSASTADGSSTATIQTSTGTAELALDPEYPRVSDMVLSIPDTSGSSSDDSGDSDDSDDALLNDHNLCDFFKHAKETNDDEQSRTDFESEFDKFYQSLKRMKSYRTRPTSVRTVEEKTSGNAYSQISFDRHISYAYGDWNTQFSDSVSRVLALSCRKGLDSLDSAANANDDVKNSDDNSSTKADEKHQLPATEPKATGDDTSESVHGSEEDLGSTNGTGKKKSCAATGRKSTDLPHPKSSSNEQGDRGKASKSHQGPPAAKSEKSGETAASVGDEALRNGSSGGGDSPAACRAKIRATLTATGNLKTRRKSASDGSGSVPPRSRSSVDYAALFADGYSEATGATFEDCAKLSLAVRAGLAGANEEDILRWIQNTLPSDVAKSTVDCLDKHIKDQLLKQANHAVATQDDDDDDTWSEKSAASGKDSKHCDCCYCEVYGHATGALPPMSANYPQMRERLRLKLKKKKNAEQCLRKTSVCLKQQQQLNRQQKDSQQDGHQNGNQKAAKTAPTATPNARGGNQSKSQPSHPPPTVEANNNANIKTVKDSASLGQKVESHAEKTPVHAHPQSKDPKLGNLDIDDLIAFIEGDQTPTSAAKNGKRKKKKDDSSAKQQRNTSSDDKAVRKPRTQQANPPCEQQAPKKRRKSKSQEGENENGAATTENLNQRQQNGAVNLNGSVVVGNQQKKVPVGQKGKDARKKGKEDSLSASEDVFEPKDIDLSGSDIDEVDKEVEMFKRFVSDTTPAKAREKVNLNLGNILQFAKKAVIS